MAWQDMSPFPTPRMDAEEEREMRLASQARAGAEWALAALIARYQPPVLRYLTRLTGNPQQSPRMAERIFVRMERRLRGPHGAEHLRLWLLRAATEAGLDVLRHPKRSRQQTQLNAPSGPRGLLADSLSAGAGDRLRAGLGKIAAITGSTRRQVRQLVWNSDEPAASGDRSQAQTASTGRATDTPPAIDPAIDSMNPEEELRHRLVRAVLAELPYGDAQCLALHLVAGLNQTEVARALGIRPSAARHRIVQGLQMFAHRYDAAITSLGVPAEVAYAEDAASLLAPTIDALDTLDVTHHAGRDVVHDVGRAHGEDYPAAEAQSPHPQHMETPPYQPYMPDEATGYTPSDSASAMTHNATMIAEPAPYEEAFPEVYGAEYELANMASATVLAAPVVESQAPASMIVDALPVISSDDGIDYPVGEVVASDDLDGQPDASWLEQPTMVPVLSVGASPGTSYGVTHNATPFVPVLTPPSNQ